MKTNDLSGLLLYGGGINPAGSGATLIARRIGHDGTDVAKVDRKRSAPHEYMSGKVKGPNIGLERHPRQIMRQKFFAVTLAYDCPHLPAFPD